MAAVGLYFRPSILRSGASPLLVFLFSMLQRLKTVSGKILSIMVKYYKILSLEWQHQPSQRILTGDSFCSPHSTIISSCYAHLLFPNVLKKCLLVGLPYVGSYFTYMASRVVGLFTGTYIFSLDDGNFYECRLSLDYLSLTWKFWKWGWWRHSGWTVGIMQKGMSKLNSDLVAWPSSKSIIHRGLYRLCVAFFQPPSHRVRNTRDVFLQPSSRMMHANWKNSFAAQVSLELKICKEHSTRIFYSLFQHWDFCFWQFFNSINEFWIFERNFQ